jgi:hypothetical protein
MVDVADASTPIQLDAARELMRSFIAWHRERHVANHALNRTHGHMSSCLCASMAVGRLD